MNSVPLLINEINDYYKSFFRHCGFDVETNKRVDVSCDFSSVLVRFNKIEQLVGVEQVSDNPLDGLNYFVLNPSFYEQEIGDFKKAFWDNEVDLGDDESWYNRRFSRPEFSIARIDFNYVPHDGGIADFESFEGIKVSRRLKRGVPRGPRGGCSSRLWSVGHRALFIPSYRAIESWNV